MNRRALFPHFPLRGKKKSQTCKGWDGGRLEEGLAEINLNTRSIRVLCGVLFCLKRHYDKLIVLIPKQVLAF